MEGKNVGELVIVSVGFLYFIIVRQVLVMKIKKDEKEYLNKQTINQMSKQ